MELPDNGPHASGVFDDLLLKAGAAMTPDEVADCAGIPPAKVEFAIAALGIVHATSRQVFIDAAMASGLTERQVRKIVDLLGGEAFLDRFAGLLGHAGRAPPPLKAFTPPT